eukprot:2610503-Prorocentrum_lima.AAC.1
MAQLTRYASSRSSNGSDFMATTLKNVSGRGGKPSNARVTFWGDTKLSVSLVPGCLINSSTSSRRKG